MEVQRVRGLHFRRVVPLIGQDAGSCSRRGCIVAFLPVLIQYNYLHKAQPLSFFLTTFLLRKAREGGMGEHAGKVCKMRRLCTDP